MKEYIEVNTTFKEKILFFLLGVINKSIVSEVEKSTPKRVPGKTYTKYPILPDPQGPPPPTPEYKPCVPDKPTPAPKIPKKKKVLTPKPPKPPPIRVIREGVSCDEELHIPFFELDNNNVKSNL